MMNRKKRNVTYRFFDLFWLLYAEWVDGRQTKANMPFKILSISITIHEVIYLIVLPSKSNEIMFHVWNDLAVSLPHSRFAYRFIQLNINRNQLNSNWNVLQFTINFNKVASSAPSNLWRWCCCCCYCWWFIPSSSCRVILCVAKTRAEPRINGMRIVTQKEREYWKFAKFFIKSSPTSHMHIEPVPIFH